MPPDAAGLDAAGTDGGTDAGTTPDAGSAGTIGPFGTPNRVAAVNSSFPEYAPTATADMLTTGDDDVAPTPGPDLLRMMLHRYSFPSYDILETTRSSTGASWDAPTLVTSLNTESNEGAPFLWTNLTVVFGSDRPGGAGSWDLYVATRPAVGDSFGGITPISELNTAEKESEPWVSPDGSYILFVRGDFGVGDNGDIWEARR